MIRKYIWIIISLIIATTTIGIPASAKTNWWDKWGEPKYGGTINYGLKEVMAYNYDVMSYPGADSDLYYDTLFDPSWTLDRAEFSFGGGFVPDEYWNGNLAKTWQWTDPTTLVVKIREGIRWQNKAPVNGREFTAYDVQAHYNRVMTPGAAPMFRGALGNWEKVTAVDKYTVRCKFKTASAQNFQSVTSRAAYNMIEAPEYAALAKSSAGQNPLQDWKNAVGTSPWILKDVVVGSSLTFAKNPGYWGTDSRHPENKLPYSDELKILIIPDLSTRMTAIRTGKLDILKDVEWQQALSLSKGNRNLVQCKLPAGTTGLQFRLDKAPFTDIRVRRALNMAIDRAKIAKSFYKGTSSSVPVGMLTMQYKGYAYSYDEWPQSLKDEFSFNPAKARALLSEAGYPNGFKTSLIASNTNNLEQLEIFKSYFKNINVDMEIQVNDATTTEALLRGGKVTQMATRGHAHNFPPDRVIDMFYSKGSDAPISGVNDAGYDALRNNFYAAKTAKESAQAFKNADKYIIENHWMLFGVETSYYYFWQPEIKGYSGEFLQWGMGLTFAGIWKNK